MVCRSGFQSGLGSYIDPDMNVDLDLGINDHFNGFEGNRRFNDSMTINGCRRRDTSAPRLPPQHNSVHRVARPSASGGGGGGGDDFGLLDVDIDQDDLLLADFEPMSGQKHHNGR